MSSRFYWRRGGSAGLQTDNWARNYCFHGKYGVVVKEAARSVVGVCVETRRPQTEAPIPGYRGYIPRVRTTELGLGTRYHDMTKNGLDSFYTARYDREKKYGPLPDTFGAQRHEPARIKRSASASN